MKKRYYDLYYSIKKEDGKYRYYIYGEYTAKEPIEKGEELCDTRVEAEQDARDAI